MQMFKSISHANTISQKYPKTLLNPKKYQKKDKKGSHKVSKHKCTL